jgi:hypothetical protein
MILKFDSSVGLIIQKAVQITFLTGLGRLIKARGDTSSGDIAYITSGHVSVIREKFLSGKEAALLWVRGSPCFLESKKNLIKKK